MKLASIVVGGLLSLAWSAVAHAAQPASAGGSVKVDKSGASTSGNSGGFAWPDFVYGGNAFSLLLPLQIGLVGYEPRARLALQYDRQLYKRHWFYLGGAGLFDRGNHKTFGENPCGRMGIGGAHICEPGAVAGFDAYLGYVYKAYVKKRPYLVPIIRAGVGGGGWWYPRIGGALHQDRYKTWTLSGRVGGGLRIFLLRELGVGFDANLSVGFARHEDRPNGMEPEKVSDFLLGLELLPNVEWRF
jgi:hypothetical protein